MFRQEQRDQEDREKKRAETDKPSGLLARMKATGWEPRQQLPVVDGIESDHTIDFTIIPIAKPLEWLFKPLVGLVRAQWLGRVAGKEAAKTVNNSASLPTNGAKLSQHLGQLDKYGAGGFKELANGRFRYYGRATLNRGDANSFRMVREWNPTSGG
ncbi:hypothetical protein [Dyadobacter sp. CY343]|uniref:hypothetical protein n=1 Tax=Dyadobacter sp. CY343 TaxID=2907299 RepID=UPI001F3A4B2A|nr:hypothetical protein [Dyadobacter sp. CY343]MCE7060685.1 hypothetical protein [Dyadobacter sp. CY343]